MKEITEKRFCETCKETVHTVTEDALEIEYSCNECGQHQDIFKTFFRKHSKQFEWNSQSKFCCKGRGLTKVVFLWYFDMTNPNGMTPRIKECQ